MEQVQLTEQEKAILDRVPIEGYVGRIKLRGDLKIESAEFNVAVEGLKQKDLIRIGPGYGGTLYRVQVAEGNEEVVAHTETVVANATEASASPPPVPAQALAPGAPADTGTQVSEYDLYPSLEIKLNDWESGFAENRLLLRTANAGRTPTGGKWTRPDFTAISVLNFMYVPGKSLEVVAFEVKKSWEEALEGVYESLAFTVFSHRAFLVVRNELGTEPLIDKVRNECGRNGVGGNFQAE